jgi:flagellar biosynthesis chaperone FliJ
MNSRLSKLRAERLAAFVLLSVVLAAGCEPVPRDDKTAELAELQKKYDDLSAQYAEASQLLSDIADKLASMAGTEQEIRDLQGDLDPATYQASEDLRQTIDNDLKVLESAINESKEKESRLTEIVSSDEAKFAAFRRTSESFRSILEGKEKVIANLQESLRQVSERAGQLEHEVETGRAENSELREGLEAEQARAREQEALIAELRRQNGGPAYCFVGTGEELHAALARGDIKRHFLTLRVAEEHLAAGEVPGEFAALDPGNEIIDFGSGWRRVKVVSAHKNYEELFYVRRSGDSLSLVLKNPAQFWAASRFLIVEAYR